MEAPGNFKLVRTHVVAGGSSGGVWLLEIRRELKLSMVARDSTRAWSEWWSLVEIWLNLVRAHIVASRSTGGARVVVSRLLLDCMCLRSTACASAPCVITTIVKPTRARTMLAAIVLFHSSMHRTSTLSEAPRGDTNRHRVLAKSRLAGNKHSLCSQLARRQGGRWPVGPG